MSNFKLLAELQVYLRLSQLIAITFDNSSLVLGFSLGKVSSVLISASILVCERLGGHLLWVVGGRGMIGGWSRGVRGGGIANRDSRCAHGGSKEQGADKSLREDTCNDEICHGLLRATFIVV